MKSSEKHIAKGFYVVIILLLLLPLLQSLFKIVKEEKLSGSFNHENGSPPKWALKKIKNGENQQQAAQYWRARMGFKNSLIRINNQINYSLFNKTNAQDVIIGKGGMLFPEQYIKSYLGTDFIGEQAIETFLQKTKFVQDTLAKRGKFLFLLVNPGKASIYSENIPPKYWNLFPPNTTNYEILIPKAKQQGVNLLDLKKYVLENKSALEYPVFPKYGLHWAGNTIAHVSDTLLAYIRTNTGFKLPDLEISEGEKTIKEYRFTDYDIGEAMNLWWYISDEVLHYPTIKYKNTNMDKPTLLGVGDSFIQSFYGFYPILDSSFSPQSQIWYYNKMVDWPYKKGVKTMWLDLEYEIEKSDVIILEMTEENIHQRGYGFIDELYDLFNRESNWLSQMQSLYSELSQDEELNKEAERLYTIVGYTKEQMKDALIKNKLENQWLIDFDFDKEVKKVMEAIKSDKKWLESVKQQAIKKNITLEESIKANAIWMVNQTIAK